MLVACVLVNRAAWEQAEPVHRRLARLWPTPERLGRATTVKLAFVLRELGFQNVRAARLKAMARAWRARRPRTSRDVEALPGCGRYASDSWAMFVEGRTDVRPTDGKLLWHLQQTRGRS